MNTPPNLSPAAAPPSRGQRLRRAAAIDLDPLRQSRDFRLLFIGQSISLAGSMLTYVAVPYEVYRLTHSSLMVGLLSLAQLGPLLLTAFLGGALADVLDRRRIAILTEAGLCLVAVGLAFNAALPTARLWPLFLAGALAAGLSGLQQPSLTAMVPQLVPREKLAAASALASLGGTGGQLLGPPLAGILLATVGLPLTFAANVLTFAVSLITLALLRPLPAPASSKGLSLAAVAEGLRYAGSRQELLGSYLIDMSAMFFGMPEALFPQVATRLGGPAALGVLYAAPSAGSLLISLSSGWTARVRRHGRALVAAAIVWGLGVIGFGLAGVLPAAVGALVVAGGADTVSGMMRDTMWNVSIPGSLRGRLASIEMLSYSSGPTLGNLESGVAETIYGLRTAIVSGGMLCIAACAGLALLLPQLWRYRTAPPPATPEAAAVG